ncbi:MAG TPA: DUF6230 family protein [Pseudonocardia sp.]|jgi:hypothetical protein
MSISATVATEPRPGVRVTGRIRWSRFILLFTCALLSLAMLATAAGTGLVPLVLAAEQRHILKISVRTLRSAGVIMYPQPFQSHDGQRHTEIVVDFRQLDAQGLCASTRVRTPLGGYVLRLAGPDNSMRLAASRLAIAVDSLDSLGVIGKQLSLRRVTGVLGGDLNLPLQHSGEQGFLPIQVGNATFNIGATLRWLAADNFHLGRFALEIGPSQPECY